MDQTVAGFANILERLRAETPGLANVVHLDNAGAALPPQQVLERQLAHLRSEAHVGPSRAADEAAAEISSVYDKAARLIGAQAEEIALVENATVAWQMAFYALPLKKGDRVLVSEAEYGANYVACLHRAQRDGVVIDVIPSNEAGTVSLKALDAMVDRKVKLIMVTHVPTNGGLVNPAVEIGRVARRHNVPYLLDACQSVGQMPIDVRSIDCDFLSAAGRKFLRGPRGSGFLYVREKWLETLHPPMIDHHAAVWRDAGSYELRATARRFENWENNYAAILGLGEAIAYAQSIGVDAIWERVKLLGAALRQRLGDIPDVAVCDIGNVQCGLVSFSVKGRAAAEVQQELARKKINVSVTTPSSTLIDATRRGLAPLIRASVHYYNTEKELDALAVAVREIAVRP